MSTFSKISHPIFACFITSSFIFMQCSIIYSLLLSLTMFCLLFISLAFFGYKITEQYGKVDPFNCSIDKKKHLISHLSHRKTKRFLVAVFLSFSYFQHDMAGNQEQQKNLLRESYGKVNNVANQPECNCFYLSRLNIAFDFVLASFSIYFFLSGLANDDSWTT